MDYETFAGQFQNGLSAALQDEGVTIQRKEVLKTNGIVKDGLVVIYPDTPAAPTVYIDDMYQMHQEGFSVENLIASTKQNLADCKTNAPEVPDLTSESAREHLYCVVVNRSENEGLLSTVPHEGLEDLAVVARYKVGENGSFLVTNEMCSQLHMTPEEVMEAAHRNTNAKELTCRPLSEVLREIMISEGMPPDFVKEFESAQEQNPLWILTNDRHDGASVITSQEALKTAHQRIGEDFYILPSSRHEVLLIPTSAAEDPEVLKNLVKEVNRDVLDKADKLSDSVYRSDGRKLTKVESPVKAPSIAEGAKVINRNTSRKH